MNENRNRFYDTTIYSTQFTFHEINGNENIPSDRVQGHQNFISVRNYHAEEVYPYYNNAFKILSNKISPYRSGNDKEIIKQTGILSTIIDEHIGLTNKQYQKAKLLVKEFYETGKVEPLIRLYTLETPFYSYINQEKQSSDHLASPIYNALQFLHPRAFEGISYRGLSMTSEDLKAYQWAEKNINRYLITNTFCSTIRDILSAQGYAEARAYDQRKPVLMVFEFLKRSLTAIQLEKLSNQLPAISEIEDEQEILILPRTTFYVTAIEQQDLSGICKTRDDPR
jgi:hypothetical protein